MRRRIIGLTIFSFFTINSLFMTARANENEDTPKTNNASASAPEAKSYDPAKAAARASANATVESELQQLRDLVQTQSKELRELTARLATMEAKVRVAKSTSTSTTAAPADGGVGATPAVTHPSLISRSLLVATASVGDQAEQPSPLSVKIVSAKFTPGGFLELATFFRSTNVGSGIAAAFGSIPFNNQLPQAALTETRFSSQILTLISEGGRGFE
jgi:hypothetical protein